MKLRFEITIAKVESPRAGPYEYKIALGSMVQQLFETDTFEILGEGDFSLSVLSNDIELGGVSFDLSLLRGHRELWLPIFVPPQKISSFSVSSLSFTSRVLLLVTETPESPGASISDDISRLKTEISIKDEDINKVGELLLESRTELDRLRTLYFDTKAQISEETTNITARHKALNEQIRTLEEENIKASPTLNIQTPESVYFKTVQTRLNESEKQRRVLQKALNSVNCSIQDISSTQNHSALEKENQGLLARIQILTNKLQESEENIRKAKMSAQEIDENLERQVNELTYALSKATQEKDEVSKRLDAYKDENKELAEFIEQLRLSLAKQEEANNEVIERIKNSAKAPLSERKDVDKALKEYMRINGLKNHFIKVANGVYSFKNKKVNVCLKNDVPVIRVGGGYLFIDEFIRVYSTQKNDENKMNRAPRLRSLSRDSNSMLNTRRIYTPRN